MKRNYALDVLKFIGIIMIIIHHSVILENVACHLYIFVEMFFMISGYLVAMRYDKLRDANVFQVMKNKVLKMYPEYFAAWAFLFIVEFVGYKEFPYKGNIFKMIAELCMASGWYEIGAMNSPIWYISVMILAEFIIILLIKYTRNKKQFIGISIFLSLLIYGVMIWISPLNIEYWEVIAFIFYVPLIRGLADMLIGCLICFLSEYCKQSMKPMNPILFNCIYFAVMAVVGVMAVWNRNTDYLCVVFIIILVFMTTFDTCVLNIKDGPVVRFMIKYQYSIYLNHFCLFLIYGKIGKYLPDNNALKIVFIVVFTIVGASIFAKAIEILRKRVGRLVANKL